MEGICCLPEQPGGIFGEAESGGAEQLTENVGTIFLPSVFVGKREPPWSVLSSQLANLSLSEGVLPNPSGDCHTGVHHLGVSLPEHHTRCSPQELSPCGQLAAGEAAEIAAQASIFWMSR